VCAFFDDVENENHKEQLQQDVRVSIIHVKIIFTSMK
jgi:hypothetical protein